MKTKLGDQPAFPNTFDFGLTKRELAAMMAMQGMLSNQSLVGVSSGMLDWVADKAIEQADDLLTKLEETSQSTLEKVSEELKDGTIK